MRNRLVATLGCCFALGLFVTACDAPQSEGDTDLTADQIAAQLAQPNGGYSLDKIHAPAFADSYLAQTLFDLDSAARDQLDKDLSDIAPPKSGLDAEITDAKAPNSGASTDPADPNTKPTDPSTTKPGDPLPPKPAPNCAGGYMHGRWRFISKTMGVFKGALLNYDGKVVGHLRGLFGYGHFRGLVINQDGTPRALLAGVYGGGQFKGKLGHKNGDLGVVYGAYGPGVFKGKWQTHCKPVCQVKCAAGFMPNPNGSCSCVPVPCKPNGCPDGMYCELCPTVCKDLATDADKSAAGDPNASTVCPAVCGTPVCRPKPTPKPTPVPPKCIDSAMGDKTSCKPADVWKKYAAGACSDKGLVLTDLSTGDPCGDGVNTANALASFRVVKFRCCQPSNTPVCPDLSKYCDSVCQGIHAPPIPPGCPIPGCYCPPPQPQCKSGMLGDDTSCKDSATWADYVRKACGTLNVNSFSVGDACTGGFRRVKFECCDKPATNAGTPLPADSSKN